MLDSLPGLPGARVFLDGAHTQESLKCCSLWFEEALSRAYGHSRPQGCAPFKTILLFNTTGGRIAQNLLAPLAKLVRPYRQCSCSAPCPCRDRKRNLFDLVLFLPNDSSLSSVAKSAEV